MVDLWVRINPFVPSTTACTVSWRNSFASFRIHHSIISNKSSGGLLPIFLGPMGTYFYNFTNPFTVSDYADHRRHRTIGFVAEDIIWNIKVINMPHYCKLRRHYRCCPHSIRAGWCGRSSVCPSVCMSVRRSVCQFDRQQQRRAAGLLLSAL